MLIEFVPNPSFQPPAPAIRVGSVVKTMDGYKRFVTQISPNRPEYKLYLHGWHSRDFFEPLPERVSGWDENGPQFSPIDPPPQEFTWSDYPPRAGMVVEGLNSGGSLRLLVGRNAYWFALDDGGDVFLSGMTTDEMRRRYRPRPDLMPRFVTEGRR